VDAEEIRIEAELDAVLASRNAQIRQRWKTDPSFREALRVRHKTVLAQRRAEEDDEELGPWLILWRRMNGSKTSERRAKEKCRELWDELEEDKKYVSSVTADPDDAPKKEPEPVEDDENEPTESFGAADEF
jgi:hypothetical protein